MPNQLSKFLNWLGWPVLAGVAIAAILLASQSQLWQHLQQSDINTTDIFDFNSQPHSYASAVKRAAPAVVNIYTRTQLNSPRNAMRDDPLLHRYLNKSNEELLHPQQQSALGSGVIVSSEGYLLTNNHVIDGADEITVLLQDGREAQALLIGSDSDTDLAVLKINLPQLPVIELGTPANAQVGDIVLAIGNPFGVGQSVSQGIISATGRYGLGLNTYENFLQTDAAINPGNSGGALIDAKGRLLGINTAVLDKIGLSSVGIGFAIPADVAIKALSDIVQYGSVVRGWLGIEARQMTPQLAQSLNLNTQTGVVITGIYKRGPAHMAGLRPGDVVIKINEQVVGDGRLSMYQIARLEPGENAALLIIRSGELLQINAIAGTRPNATDS